MLSVIVQPIAIVEINNHILGTWYMHVNFWICHFASQIEPQSRPKLHHFSYVHRKQKMNEPSKITLLCANPPMRTINQRRLLLHDLDNTKQKTPRDHQAQRFVQKIPTALIHSTSNSLHCPFSYVCTYHTADTSILERSRFVRCLVRIVRVPSDPARLVII